MTPDRIVEEVHRVRETLLARFNGDLRALVQDVRRREAESGRRVVQLPPRRPAVRPTNTKRAG
jgi:hypothetical protein